MSDKKAPAITGQKRAGLNFSVSRAKQIMKDRLPKDCRHGGTAHVAFAAVLEYICAEVLELASNHAKECGRKRVTPRDIFLAIKNDVELARLFSGITIKEGGVIPAYNRVAAANYAKTHKKPIKQ